MAQANEACTERGLHCPAGGNSRFHVRERFAPDVYDVRAVRRARGAVGRRPSAPGRKRKTSVRRLRLYRR